MRSIEHKHVVANSFSAQPQQPAHVHRKVRSKPHAGSLQMKHELVSRLYGTGVPYLPLPSVKRSFDVQDPAQRPLTAKVQNMRYPLIAHKGRRVSMSPFRRRMKELNITVHEGSNPMAEASFAYHNEEALRAYQPLGDLNLSEIDRPANKPVHYMKNAQLAREAIYSTNRPSITGISVMSSLKPRLNTSLDRSSAYSVRAGTAQGQRRKVLRDQEESHPKHKTSASYFDVPRGPPSPQEQQENICSRKLIESMRHGSASQGRRPTAPAALGQKPEESFAAILIPTNVSRGGTAAHANQTAVEIPVDEFPLPPLATELEKSPVGDKRPTQKVEEVKKVAETIPWADMDNYIEALLEGKSEAISKFMYFNLKDCKENAYDLEITDYARRNVARHYTISKKGVTQYNSDEAVEFVPLKEWLIERELFNKVKGISFFCNFHRWKMVKAWRKRIWSARKKQITDDLEEKLFYLDPIYRDHLLQHKSYMCEMARLRLVDVQKQNDTGSVEEFAQRQRKKRKEVGTKVREYSGKCRANVRQLIKECLDKLRNRILLEKSLNDDRAAVKTSKEEAKKTTPNPVFENLGFPENMTYGHRAALRRECSRFLRLAYLLDFMSIKSLSDIYVDTVRDTLRVLNYLDQNAVVEINAGQDILRKAITQEPILLVSVAFDPKQAIPNDKVVSKEIKPFSDKISRPKDFDLSCHVEVTAEKEDESATLAQMLKKYVRKEVPDIIDYWLRLVPSKEEFYEMMMRCLSEGMRMLEVFERWSRHDELLPYASVLEDWDEIVGGDWDVPESNCLSPKECISRSPDYLAQEQDFRALVLSTYGKCYDFMKKFNRFLNVYWRDANADLSLIVHERVVKPAETVANALRLLEYQKKMFLEKIPETCNIGVLKLDCGPVRKALIPAPGNAMHQIELLANEAVRSRLEQIKAWMSTARNRLDVRVDTVADYVKQRVAWSDISDVYQETKDKVDVYGEIYAIMGDFNMPPKKDDKQQHTEALQEIVQMSQLLSNVSDQQELNMEKFRRMLQDQLIPQLESNLEQLKKDIDDEVLLSRQEDIDRIIAKIDSLETRLRSYEELSVRYNEYQQKLNIEPAVFDSLVSIKDGLTLRSELWHSLKKWGTLTQGWIGQQFATINAKEIGAKADEFATIAARVDKELPENPVSKELKAMVETFRKAVPIVAALRNEALKKQHWKAIKELLQAEFDTNDHGFTLRSLLDLKAINYQDEIQQISVQASQEALLGRQLEQMEERWRKCTFTTKQCNMKEAYVLDKTDELFNLLDESLVAINAILGDRYIKPLLSVAENWRQTLVNLQAIMDEWVTCQKEWMYLDGIGPDVRRELGSEAIKFEVVDKFFKGLMQKAMKSGQPLKLLKTYKGDLLDHLRHHNKMMDEIKKLFQDYLDAKRRLFPRFYFLSGEELLSVLSNQQQLDIVQRSLRMLFTSLSQLELREGLDVVAFLSAEGERIPLAKSVRLKDDAVGWLEPLQIAVKETLQKNMKAAIADHDELERKEWLLKYPCQVVHAVSHVIWCAATESAMSELVGNSNAMVEWYEENVGQIQQFVELSRAHAAEKAKSCAMNVLLAAAVHSRDVIEELVLANVSHTGDFNWQKELRFYWEDEEVVQAQQSPVYLVVRQMNSRVEYGSEYIGPSSRMIVTAPTVRAWVGVTSALSSRLSVAMVGANDSGKAETVQELAKMVGTHCVVINCLGQTNCRAISRAFSGAAQQGAWVCLSALNRVGQETLSVAAKQLGELRSALLRGSGSIVLDEKELAIKSDFGIFATIAQGPYASRGMSALPENMKCNFRPVLVGVPDPEKVCEATMLIAGFVQGKVLAKKLCGICKSMSHLLSSQTHYDFSLRCIFAITRAAAESLPTSDEIALLSGTVKKVLGPRIVPEDLTLFQGLVLDFFPIPVPQPLSPSHKPVPKEPVKQVSAEEGTLKEIALKLMDTRGLKRSEGLALKVVQLFQQLAGNAGVIVIGPAGCGKTTISELLMDAINELSATRPEQRKVVCEVINPKALSMSELFGGTSPLTQDWIEGLVPRMIKRMPAETNTWIRFDGPMDPVWTQALSHTLDLGKNTLSLPNGEMIRPRPGDGPKLLFETDSLSSLDPGTVSRCGVVSVPSDLLTWQAIVEGWTARVYRDDPELKGHLYFMFEETIERGISKVRASGPQLIKTSDLQLVENVCNLIEVILPSAVMDKSDKKKIAALVYCFAFVWGVGGTIDDSAREKLDLLIRSIFENVEIPPSQSVFECYMDPKKSMAFRPWAEIVPAFSLPSPTEPQQQLVVPTVETVRQTYFVEQFLARNRGVLFTGGSGAGKSMIVSQALRRHKDDLLPIFLSCSGATTSLKAQLAVEEKLQKKRRDTYGAQVGQKVAIFVDDVNLPTKDSSGARPAVEFLRQLVERRGAYDREKLSWKRIEDFNVMCSTKGLGGDELSPRFTRKFNIISLARPSKASAEQIFTTILGETMKAKGFPDQVQALAHDVVVSTNDVYNLVSAQMKPIPSKFFYTFSLRDIAKVFQGVTMAESKSVHNVETFARLWTHELSRVFQDRLVGNEDRAWVANVIFEHVSKAAKVNWDYCDIFELHRIHWNRSFKPEQAPAAYEEIKDLTEVRSFFDLELANVFAHDPRLPSLAFYEDAVENILKISRVFAQSRGYLLLIGNPGIGKSTLTKFAAFVSKCDLRELQRSTVESLLTVMKEIVQSAGVAGKQTCLLLTQKQVESEDLMDVVNSLMCSSGEIPCLYTSSELDQIVSSMRPVAAAMKREESRGSMYATFLERVRDNLKIVFSASPSLMLPEICRKFPALLEEAAVVHVAAWETPVLLGMSKRCMGELEDCSAGVKHGLAEAAVGIHNVLRQEIAHGLDAIQAQYIDFLRLFLRFVKTKRQEMASSGEKTASALDRLKEAKTRTEEVNSKIDQLQAQLKEKTAAAEMAQKKVSEQQKLALEAERAVNHQKRDVDEKTKHTKTLYDEAETEVNATRPEMVTVMNDVKLIDKKAWQDIMTTTSPHPTSVMILEALMILLQEKTDWNSVRNVIEDTNAFMSRLVAFTERRAPVVESVVKKLKVNYLNLPELDPDQIKGKAIPFKPMARWIRFVTGYQDVLVRAEPKRRKYEAEKEKFDKASALLAAKVKTHAEARAKIAQLKGECESLQQAKAQIAEEIAATKRRAGHSEELTVLLAEEGERWKREGGRVRDLSARMLGNLLVSAAYVEYAGVLDQDTRVRVAKEWVRVLGQHSVMVSDPFDLSAVLGNPQTVEDWVGNGLPKDGRSEANAIIAMDCWRWPLILDPFGCANRWLKTQLKKQGVITTKLANKECIKALENAARLGKPLLIEDVDEVPDPAFDPVFYRCVVHKKDSSAVPTILLEGKENEYDDGFRLFMTSTRNLAAAAQSLIPTLLSKTTMIDFGMSVEALEEMSLLQIVAQEALDTETQRENVLKQIAADKQSQKEAEDRILKLLAGSTLEQVLDDETGLETLKNAKKSATEIGKKVTESVQRLVNLTEAREKYRGIAARVALLFRTAAIDMSRINETYIYSMESFRQVFTATLASFTTEDPTHDRIQRISERVTAAVFASAARGLVEQDKLGFAFLYLMHMRVRQGAVKPAEWFFFLHDSTWSDNKGKPIEPEKNALPDRISEEGWRLAQALDKELPEKFSGLVADLTKNGPKWESSLNQVPAELPEAWKVRLGPFDKLIFAVKVLQQDPEKAIARFVDKELGSDFLRAATSEESIERAFEEMKKITPMLIFPGPGAQTLSAVQRLAEKRKFSEKLAVVSLGQDQGLTAKRVIQAAQGKGEWVLLENCQLAAGWAKELESIVEAMKEPKLAIHDDFRLFLSSSMGANIFSAAMLATGVRVALEVPKSPRREMREAVGEMMAPQFDGCTKRPLEFRRLAFGLCRFHCEIKAEYGAGNLDLESALLMLRWAVDDQEEIQWDSIYFYVGNILYGSRAATELERGRIMSTLKEMCSPAVLQPEYTFSGGVHFPVKGDTIEEYQAIIDKLGDDAEGSASVLANIKKSQERPRAIVLSSETNAVEKAKRLEHLAKVCTDIQDKLPSQIDVAAGNKELFQSKTGLTPFTTVLLHEVEKYNALLETIGGDLERVQRFLFGGATDESLADIIEALERLELPRRWAAKSYPTDRLLESYFRDLATRVEYFRTWTNKGEPKSFWMSAFFSPDAFLSAAIRTHSIRTHTGPERLWTDFRFLSDKAEADALATKGGNLVIHGLYLQGAGWDRKQGVLTESVPAKRGETTLYETANGGVMLPPVLMQVTAAERPERDEDNSIGCRVFQTERKSGQLEMTLNLRTEKRHAADFWAGKGTAIVLQLSE